jgi:hypothetical protein
MFILQAALSVGKEDMYSLRRYQVVIEYSKRARTQARSVSLYSLVEVVRGRSWGYSEHGLQSTSAITNRT